MKQLYDYISLFLLTGILSATVTYNRIKHIRNKQKKIDEKRKNARHRRAA